MTTQTDRELLELAAKASGFKLEQGYGQPPEKCLFYMDSEGCCHDWNPLDDDSDALRLMVALNIDVDYGEDLTDEPVGWSSHFSKFGGWFEEPLGIDPCAATRRVIVRAAAEIGKEMR